MSGEEFFRINSSTPMEGGYSFYTSTTGTTSTSANSFVSAWDAEKQARQRVIHPKNLVLDKHKTVKQVQNFILNGNLF